VEDLDEVAAAEEVAVVEAVEETETAEELARTKNGFPAPN